MPQTMKSLCFSGVSSASQRMMLTKASSRLQWKAGSRLKISWALCTRSCLVLRWPTSLMLQACLCKRQRRQPAKRPTCCLLHHRLNEARCYICPCDMRVMRFPHACPMQIRSEGKGEDQACWWGRPWTAWAQTGREKLEGEDHPGPPCPW